MKSPGMSTLKVLGEGPQDSDVMVIWCLGTPLLTGAPCRVHAGPRGFHFKKCHLFRLPGFLATADWLPPFPNFMVSFEWGFNSILLAHIYLMHWIQRDKRERQGDHQELSYLSSWPLSSRCRCSLFSTWQEALCLYWEYCTLYSSDSLHGPHLN